MPHRIRIRFTMGKSPLRRPSALLPLALLPALAACGSGDAARTFGLVRDAPDEFRVTTRAPLSMPPDYTLRPPRPGAQRPQEQSARSAAEAALVPETALAGGQAGAESPGEQLLVSEAGPPAPADIRRKVEAEAALDQPDRSLTDRLMFWKSAPPPGVVVDPGKEAQRLRENAALGHSPEAGDTPIIQRKSSSSLF
jgi:hypothetical protein